MEDIIEKYYDKNSELYKILVEHSLSVTQKALSISEQHPELGIDNRFVGEAGMIHDIGIFMTNAPSIHSFGTHPYIAHGYLGSELMQAEGYPKHALVCERHTGTGLTTEAIIAQNLPLPHRDMLPLSIEEKVICFADCFYSKSKLGKEKTPEQVIASLSKFGGQSVNRFVEWCDLFL
ncbi:HD domain-containing protein [Viscerimonas tarda]